MAPKSSSPTGTSRRVGGARAAGSSGGPTSGERGAGASGTAKAGTGKAVASTAGPGSEPATKTGVRGFAAKVASNLRQIGQAYTLTVRSDRRLPLWLALTFVVAFLLVWGIGWLLGVPGYFAFLGVIFGLLAALIVFGRRAERAAYAQLEGRPGAAAAALNTLKRGWTISPAVGGTRTLEIVHRAVGRPGIVLIGEGPSRGRVTGLLQNEVRRHNRVAPGIPVRTVQVGTAQGQVPIAKLPRHLRKMPAVLTPGDAREVNQRLKALRLGAPQTPHGPVPRNARLPKGLRPPTDADVTGGGR